jgi:hypothetical protein
MWPFSNQVEYATPPGVTPTVPPASSGGSSFGGSPTYVTPPGATGGTAGPAAPAPSFPPIIVDIACPAFATNGVTTADGSTVAVIPPVGATKYQVWFSPTPPDSAGEHDAVPFDTDGPSSGPIVGGEVQIAPRWTQLGNYAVTAGSVKAKLLVTFQ